MSCLENPMYPSTHPIISGSAAKKAVPQVIEISSDSDEEQSTPVPRKLRRKSRYVVCLPFTEVEINSDLFREIKEEAKVDADIDDLLDDENTTEIPFDSIMDGDSEEEEDEVNDLLAEE